MNENCQAELETSRAELETSRAKVAELQKQLDDIKSSDLTSKSEANPGILLPPATPDTVAQGGNSFFGGADNSFAPLETTTKLYTGPVLGGKRTRRHKHKNKRHSYSRKSKKGLKNKLKRLFGFKGGEGKAPTFSLPKGPSGGGGTTVKSQH